MKHKHSRYPGQPDWIDREFPMYKDAYGNIRWKIIGMGVNHLLCGEEGVFREAVLPAKYKPLAPIYEHPWHTLCACWSDNWSKRDSVHFGTYMIAGGTYTYVVPIPQHILDMDSPPRIVAEWQQMVDDGDVEVIE